MEDIESSCVRWSKIAPGVPYNNFFIVFVLQITILPNAFEFHFQNKTSEKQICLPKRLSQKSGIGNKFKSAERTGIL